MTVLLWSGFVHTGNFALRSAALDLVGNFMDIGSVEDFTEWAHSGVDNENSIHFENTLLNNLWVEADDGVIDVDTCTLGCTHYTAVVSSTGTCRALENNSKSRYSFLTPTSK